MRKLLGAAFTTLFILGLAGAATACPYSDKTDTSQTEKDQLSS